VRYHGAQPGDADEVAVVEQHVAPHDVLGDHLVEDVQLAVVPHLEEEALRRARQPARRVRVRQLDR
jgi:hypothetical protein